MSHAQGTRRPSPLAWWLLGFVTLLSYLPLLGLVATFILSAALGCPVDEAHVHACPVLGGCYDIGELLYGGLLLVWLMVFMMLPMIGLTAVWVVVGIKAWRRRIAARRQAL